MRYRRRLIVAIVFVLASPIVALPAHADDREIVFEDDVAPLLRLYCWSCHGGGGKSADLDLRTQPLILAGGKSGAVMTPGDPDGSPLYKKLVDGQMPPKESVCLRMSSTHR